MKKLCVIIVLLLLIIIASYGKRTKSQPAASDTLKLQLINPVKQEIKINCVDLNRKFYFINDITLSKDDITGNKSAFILNDDLTISEAVLNDATVPLRVYRKFNSFDFLPELDKQTFAHVKSKARVYEFIINPKEDLPELVTIRLKYHFVDKDSLFSIPSDNTWIDFRSSDYWYPHNPNIDEKISLFVKTSDLNSFYLNGRAVDYIQKRYLKEYKISFIDETAKPAVLMFRKSGLK